MSLEVHSRPCAERYGGPEVQIRTSDRKKTTTTNQSKEKTQKHDNRLVGLWIHSVSGGSCQENNPPFEKFMSLCFLL